MLAWHWFPNAAYAAAWGVALGGVAQLSSCFGQRRARVCICVWSAALDTGDQGILQGAGAVTFGAASVVVAPLIDFFIASFLPIGSRTALYYADRINQLPLGVLGIALGTVLLPDMSARLARAISRLGCGAESLRRPDPAADACLLSPLPSPSPAPSCARFSRMARSTRHAARCPPLALMAYGVGFPAMALVRIVASTFYARHDTMTPARATVTAHRQPISR